MSQRPVPVTVDVATDNGIVIVIVVMTVIVGVVVFVFHRCVAMIVLVITMQKEPDPTKRHDERQNLATVDSLAEHHPRCDCTDERCGREDQLASGHPQFTGTSNPQRDGRTVPNAANEQRCRDSPTRRRVPEHQADSQVGSPGNSSLCEGYVHGRKLVESRRKTVLQSRRC